MMFHAIRGAARRVLQTTTRENINPSPSPEVRNLQDEHRLTDIHWRQSYNELHAGLKTVEDRLKMSEEKNEELQNILQREIGWIITSLMVEMIDTILGEGDGYWMEPSPETKTKKCRFI